MQPGLARLASRVRHGVQCNVGAPNGRTTRILRSFSSILCFWVPKLADPRCCVRTQLGVQRLAGGPAPGWAWAQAPGAPAGDGALTAHSVAAMVENALRLEVRGILGEIL